LEWIKKDMLASEHYIHETDLNFIKLVDSADEAVGHIVDFYNKYLLKPNF
jgi:predicted Rossmann-fold nucleotide-binding protein